MKKMGRIHDFLEKIFNTKPFSVVFSILCAVLIWFSVSVTTYKTTHVTFYNIPLSDDISGTLAEANGLSTVSCNVESVTVELEGNRSQIGRLTREDLKAHLQLGNINSAGEFNFDIAVQSDTGISFNTLSISPAYATVKLDKIETETFDVTAVFPNIRVSSGHALNQDNVVCEPSVIEITGPSEQLKEISRVEVYSDKSMMIDSLYSLYAEEIRLYTKEGARLDTDDLEMPSTNFQITIPVLTQKELALTYDIRNAFSGFDLNWLRERLHLSEESITLASQTNTEFVKRDSWSVGYITLDSVTLDFSKKLEIELSDDFINQSGFQQVELTLDNEGLASREFWITADNISIVNAPKDYSCEIITRSMPITIIGEEEELNNLSTQDIIATVDLMNYNVQQNATGSPDAVISFSPKRDIKSNEEKLVRTWAVGNPRVAVYFREKEPETEPETETLAPTEED